MEPLLESAALFAAKRRTRTLPISPISASNRAMKAQDNVGAFLTFLHDKMYPGFKFVDVKIYIDTPDQAYGEYTIHQKSGISGKLVHQRFFGQLRGERWKDRAAP